MVTTQQPIPLGAQARFAPDELVVRPRDVQFSFGDSPLHWIPGEPYASHAVTALNLFLPAADRWFSNLLSDVLAYVNDEHLREEIVGFIGQEAVHARTHDRVLVDYLRRHGIAPGPFQRQLDWMAGQYSDRGPADPRRRRRRGVGRVARQGDGAHR